MLLFICVKHTHKHTHTHTHTHTNTHRHVYRLVREFRLYRLLLTLTNVSINKNAITLKKSQYILVDLVTSVDLSRSLTNLSWLLSIVVYCVDRWRSVSIADYRQTRFVGVISRVPICLLLSSLLSTTYCFFYNYCCYNYFKYKFYYYYHWLSLETRAPLPNVSGNFDWQHSIINFNSLQIITYMYHCYLLSLLSAAYCYQNIKQINKEN